MFEAQGDIMRPGLFHWVMMVDRYPVIRVVIHIGDRVFCGVYGTADDMEAIEVFDITGITMSNTIFSQSIG